MNDTRKRCTQCGSYKLLKEFSPHNSRPCAYQTACKACRSANARAARWAKKKGLADQVRRSLK